MVVTFTRMKYDDIPEQIAEAVLKFTDREVVIDETLLTAQQQQKVRDYLIQEGYKQV